jgi:hypothetical protein
MKGSFIPEFLASLLDRVVNPCRALLIVLLGGGGAVLFGIYVQHETPIIMQTPPFFSQHHV